MASDWPRRIDICPWGDWYAESTATSGAIARGQDSTCLSGGILGAGNPTAIGTYREWKIPLSAGTWALTFIHSKNTFAGIVDVSIDGVVVVDDLDMYNGSSTRNNVSDTTGISITTSGVKTLRFEIIGKNASASHYSLGIQWITFRRTA